MAIISPGPLAAAVSGSIGGTVFSRNRGGSYVRNRSIPTDPNTVRQQNVRAILASQSQAWSDLTDLQRDAFGNWALQNPVTNALGHQITLSGHQAFVQLNSRLDLDDQTVLTDPPVINAPMALDTLVLTADIGVGDVEVAFTATPLAADVKLWIRAAVVNSPGITYVRNLFKFVGTSAAAAASPFVIQTLVEDVFGTLIVGQTLHVRAGTFDVTTGLVSVTLDDFAVVESTV